MKHSTQHRPARRRSRSGRSTAVIMVLLGASSPLFASGVARAATSHTTARVLISTATNAKLGTVLVSRTALYTLRPSATPCRSACWKYWPEVLLPKGVTKATAGKGVIAARLGTVKRPGGRLQVTYAGKALYWFSGDTTAGQVRGNLTDTWGRWSAVVTKRPSTGSTSTSTPRSGGATTTTTANPGGGGVGF